MVQNVNMQGNSPFGTIDKIGTTENGRSVYQISDGSGKVAGRVSVAGKDCDTFEKSYETIINAAPKLQKFAENTTPEKMKKKQKTASWTIGILSAVGTGLAIFFTRNAKTWKQCLAALGGLVGGFGVGVFSAKKMLTPPGANEINEATKAISQLDIQPLK